MEKISTFFLKIYPIEGIPTRRRVLLHSIFWLIIFISQWVTLIPSFAVIYNLITIFYFITLAIIFFYTTVYFIFPFWNNKNNYRYLITFLFVIIFTISWAILCYIRLVLIFHYDLLKGFNINLNHLRKIYDDFWLVFNYNTIVFSIISIFFITLPAFFIKLIRSLLKNYSEKKQVEIDYLRSQINPHFLTNTLNNIYSLSVTDDKRNSDAILSLSSLLDYVLYESNQPTISLEKEVNFLSNFIELEKIRNTKRLQVNFEVEGDIHGNIPPMILVTFVENAFKHCIGDLYSNSFIKILLKVDDDKLYFEVENSKSNLTTNNQRKTFGGIGLTNVKKRLSTLYPNNHSLEIHDKKDTYVIILRLGLM